MFFFFGFQKISDEFFTSIAPVTLEDQRLSQVFRGIEKNIGVKWVNAFSISKNSYLVDPHEYAKQCHVLLRMLPNPTCKNEEAQYTTHTKRHGTKNVCLVRPGKQIRKYLQFLFKTEFLKGF